VSILLAVIGCFGGEDAAVLSAAWSSLSANWPTFSQNNEDRTITWSAGGARTIAANYAGGNNLQYRINSGTWVAYSAGFSLSSGQTVAWRVLFSTDEFETVSVTENGRALGSFTVSASGYP